MHDLLPSIELTYSEFSADFRQVIGGAAFAAIYFSPWGFVTL